MGVTIMVKMKTILALILISLAYYVATPGNARATSYSTADQAFKQANLGRLIPHGPGVNEGLGPLWTRFIDMAAKYQDYEIASKIFAARRKAHGATSTSYALDLLKLYQAHPGFFVKSARRHFKGNFWPIFAVWFDGNGTVSLMDIQGPAKRVPGNRLVQEFLEIADSADQKSMSMN